MVVDRRLTDRLRPALVDAIGSWLRSRDEPPAALAPYHTDGGYQYRLPPLVAVIDEAGLGALAERNGADKDSQDAATALIQRVAADLAAQHRPLIAYVTNLSYGTAAADLRAATDAMTRLELRSRKWL